MKIWVEFLNVPVRMSALGGEFNLDVSQHMQVGDLVHALPLVEAIAAKGSVDPEDAKSLASILVELDQNDLLFKVVQRVWYGNDLIYTLLNLGR